MDLATVIERWIEHHPPQLWAVVVAALVLAWLDRGGKLGRIKRYDAWWLFNLRHSDTKLARRSRRSE
jgi:hypothetical protein